jgi:hypothetical protein
LFGKSRPVFGQVFPVTGNTGAHRYILENEKKNIDMWKRR